MTRDFGPHELLDDLPPRPRVLATHVRLAPEIAVLAVLDDAARTALVALVAVHPLLDQPPHGHDQPTLRRARLLTRRALQLRDALDDYRRAIFGDFDSPQLNDDIQF